MIKENKQGKIKEGYSVVSIKIEDSESIVEFKETIDSIATCKLCSGYCDLSSAFIYGDMHIEIKDGKIRRFICADCIEEGIQEKVSVGCTD